MKPGINEMNEVKQDAVEMVEARQDFAKARQDLTDADRPGLIEVERQSLIEAERQGVTQEIAEARQDAAKHADRQQQPVTMQIQPAQGINRVSLIAKEAFFGALAGAGLGGAAIGIRNYQKASPDNNTATTKTTASGNSSTDQDKLKNNVTNAKTGWALISSTVIGAAIGAVQGVRRANEQQRLAETEAAIQRTQMMAQQATQAMSQELESVVTQANEIITGQQQTIQQLQAQQNTPQVPELPPTVDTSIVREEPAGFHGPAIPSGLVGAEAPRNPMDETPEQAAQRNNNAMDATVPPADRPAPDNFMNRTPEQNATRNNTQSNFMTATPDQSRAQAAGTMNGLVGAEQGEGKTVVHAERVNKPNEKHADEVTIRREQNAGQQIAVA